MMHTLARFGRFWYDFIVGDDWTIAITVAVAVAATAVLEHHGWNVWWLLPLTVAATLAVSLWHATHASTRTTAPDEQEALAVLTYFRAAVIGALQGVTELFPISSLGHSVLFAAWVGWDDLVHAQSQSESFYLAFIVALHVATAAALFIYFRKDWYAIIGGLVKSLGARRVVNADARLGVLLIVATIPAGITGLAFEHELRTVFAKPLAAAVFLTINGLILAVGELLIRHRAKVATGLAGTAGSMRAPGRPISSLGIGEALLIGVAQIAALFAGISRSGITMVAGLGRGLDHEDAARFSFLLATPIIAAAGLYKIPDLLGPLGNGIRGEVLVGAIVAGISAYLSTRFLIRYFQTRTLWPFAFYCFIVGGLSIIHFA